MKALATLITLFLALSARAELFVSSHDNSRVLRYNETTGAFIDVFIPNNDARLQFPHGLIFGPDRNLYVASAGNDRVLRYNGQTGAFIDEFITAGSGGLNYPVALIFRGDYLYVSSQLDSRVLRYHSVTGAFIDEFVAARPELNGPSEMRFYGDSLYVVGRFSNNVARFDGATGAFLETFISSGLSQPFGLRFNDSGYLFVASSNENAIKRFFRSGQFLAVQTISAPENGLSFPVGIAIGPDGLAYVASYQNNKVARYNLNTGAYLGDFVSVGAGGLDGPNFMTFRPAAPALSIRIAGQGIQVSWPWLQGDYTYALYEASSPDFSDEQRSTRMPIMEGGVITVVVGGNLVGGNSRGFFRLRNP